MQRIACIDIGTVTCRLAVADVEDGRVLRLIKESTITDLGEGLSASGRSCEAAKRRVTTCAGRYVAQARAAQAPLVCCTLTSAARDAENSSEIVSALEGLGLAPQVIPGDVEGRLTFLGVSQDFPGEAVLVADNGGGSTELALGAMTDGVLDLAFVRSFDVGCRRVTERFLSARESGIPTEEELAEAHEFSASYFRQGAELLGAAAIAPTRLVACGGTVTSLVAMDAKLVPYDSKYVHLHELTLEDVERLEREVKQLSVAERAQLAGLQPQRAPVILGGIVAISELLRCTGFEALTVSESDLLFGLAIVSAAAAEGSASPVGWLPKLASLA